MRGRPLCVSELETDLTEESEVGTIEYMVYVGFRCELKA